MLVQRCHHQLDEDLFIHILRPSGLAISQDMLCNQGIEE